MNLSKAKVAIVHYWLVNMRGGEKVIEAILDVFPQADIFTLVHDPKRISEKINSRPIKTSFIQGLPFGVSKYQNFFPLFPLAVEQFDLSGYDIVISSDSGFTKMALTRADQLHVCYCHTPMRYAWDKYFEYLNHSGLGFIKKRAMQLFMHYTRLTDLAASFRVDRFIANSDTVRRRIKKHYRREAEVIHPPVDCSRFDIAAKPYGGRPFYLFIGQLIPYKKPDVAVEAFNKLGADLVIAGGGEMEARLKKMANPNIRFAGKVPNEELVSLYQNCEALIFPNEEDFGIVPVECMAAGKPVIALSAGGAAETVIDGVTGIHFSNCDAQSLTAAVRKFETVKKSFDPVAIRKHALGYDGAVFHEKFARFMEAAVREGI